jgi:5-methylcytosine-specific restriction protein A
LRYQLAGVFQPAAVRPCRGGWSIIGGGLPFEPQHDVTDRSWFRRLLREQGNFRFGFGRLRNQTVVRALRRFKTEQPRRRGPRSRKLRLTACYKEGEARQVTADVYERSRAARSACLDRYGCRCVVCGFDFRAFYGDLGRGFIHVHHLRPLSEAQSRHRIDPVRDLRPVCPNCHAMLHAGNDVLTIEALKALVKAHADRS